MAKNRVFTDQELKELSTRTMDAAVQAVEAGDKEKAKKLITRMSKEFQGIHDLYMNWAADLMDYIYTHNGEDALYQAMRKVVESYMGPLAEAYGKADFKRQVTMAAAGLRAHLEALEIEEDDEKVSIKMKPCGSGQRLMESGAYDSPRKLSRLKAHPMTWGLPDFPIYCAHSPIQEMVGIERIGRPAFACIPSEPMAKESCRFLIYKDPDAIPEQLYTRVGKKKPKRS
ncbi:MAG: hypothetical protein Q7T04_01775 [Dehalococcoidia bacterium]|nr:hypothetical protein [Dehalococcoidia bacterium]